MDREGVKIFPKIMPTWFVQDREANDITKGLHFLSQVARATFLVSVFTPLCLKIAQLTKRMKARASSLFMMMSGKLWLIFYLLVVLPTLLVSKSTFNSQPMAVLSLIAPHRCRRKPFLHLTARGTSKHPSVLIVQYDMATEDSHKTSYHRYPHTGLN